ncbi:MAG: hypothetical protein H7Y13_17645, partial [Sphingobacteriaceae bacterium]|nr:hypothetical protein [Sphingobacteriaceae bacterium]
MINFSKIKLFSTAVLFSLMFSAPLIAQQLPQINYQGVARKSDGSPVTEQSITLRLTIRDGAATGNSVYSETRQRTTNKFGLFTVIIGSTGASSQSGSMLTVNWATGNKFLQVEIDPSGGFSFIDMGTTQLQSVPYAIYATSAAPSGTAAGDLGGSFPNPTVNKIQGFAVSVTAPGTGQVLKWDGNAWAPTNESGGTVVQAALDLKENVSNKSTNITADATSDSKYPSVKSVKLYVDENTATNTTALNAEITRATTAEANLAANNNAEIIAEVNNRTAADATLATNLTAEITRATAAEATKEAMANKSTDGTLASNSDVKYPSEKAVKTYTDAAIATVSIPDASSSVKGKLQLAGDLTGTSALPQIASNAIITSKIADASVTDAKIATGISASKVGLGNVNNTSDADKPISTATQTALDTKASNADIALKANLASPTFTGTVSGIAKSMVGLGNVDNTSDTNKPVSTATQTALDAKASNADIALKANLASPTFTGTVSGITKSMVGLGNVDNTTDLLKPVSTATQSALDAKASTTDVDLKAPLASPTFTGTVSGITKSMVGLGNVDNTTDAGKPISTAAQTALDAKAPLASPTFTGTVSGITSAMVGLGNVDNTTDLNKPISTATQTALDLKSSASDLALKAPLASPTFTGTVSGITKTMVGLGNVDNTTDLLKPISTATQTALDLKSSTSDLALKAPLASPTFTGTVSGITAAMVGLANVDNTTDLNKPISTATQSALDLKSSASDLALKAPLASPTFTGTVSGITKT